MTRVILDISRLISRVRYPSPSGIDRVEMAYARGLLRIYQDDLDFAAVHPTGICGMLYRPSVLSYLDDLEERWSSDQDSTARRSISSVIPSMFRLLPRIRPNQGQTGRPVYIQASPHHLDQPKKVLTLLNRTKARFLCLVHDLIPIEYPEYARPSGSAQHRRRMETVAQFADAVVFNSAATGRSFDPWIARNGRSIVTQVALLGTEPVALPPTSSPAEQRPYFVCIGTIEPRKNHLLLLNLWRQMVETLPASDVPQLLIIGRRGWENEQVLDMLDRCSALVGFVEEVGACSNQRLATLLRSANGLLMPSFAEGFGMPIAEALSVGVPVICSDIAAHQEVGGATPDFLEPLDGPSWGAHIQDFARNGPIRRAQLARMTRWSAPTWEEHMLLVAKIITKLAHTA
ncbi:MAG: glycosyltransferase family 1 protein [Novosphingobium sp.]